MKNTQEKEQSQVETEKDHQKTDDAKKPREASGRPELSEKNK